MSSSTDHVNDTDASCHGNMPSDKPTGWWFQPTPLKNMSQWEGWHPIYEMENNPNVPNHQPANICLRRLSIAATKLDSTVDWPIRKYIGASPTQPLVSSPRWDIQLLTVTLYCCWTSPIWWLWWFSVHIPHCKASIFPKSQPINWCPIA